MKSLLYVFVLLSSASFALTLTLTPKMLNEATQIRGVKLPEGFDASKLNLRNRVIDYIDFSLVKNLSIHQINSARSIVGIKFPKNFNLRRFKTRGKDLGEVDFTNTRGLTARMINRAKSIERIIFPKDFSLRNVNFTGKSLWRVDLSQVKFLSVRHLNQAASISNIKLPDGFKLQGLKTKGKDISGINFSKSQGLTIQMINDAKNVDEIVYPDGFSFKGFNGESHKLFWNDLSKVKDFSLNYVMAINGGAYLTLPAVDVSGADFTGKDFTRVSMKNLIGLEPSMLQNAWGLPSAYPDNFDMSRIDLRGRSLFAADLSNTRGFTVSDFEQLSNTEWMTFPKGFSFKNVNTKGLSLGGISNFYECTNDELFNTLTPEQLNNAKNYEFNCFPADYDMTNVKLVGNKRGLNLKRVKNLKGSSLSLATNLRYTILPENFDFTGFDGKGTSLRKLDLSKTVGLTTKMLNDSTGLSQTKLPVMDMTGFDPSNKYLWKTDLSQVKGLTVKMLEKALSLSELKLPKKFDLTGFNTKGKDLSFIDFRDIK